MILTDGRDAAEVGIRVIDDLLETILGIEKQARTPFTKIELDLFNEMLRVSKSGARKIFTDEKTQAAVSALFNPKNYTIRAGVIRIKKATIDRFNKVVTPQYGREITRKIADDVEKSVASSYKFARELSNAKHDLGAVFGTRADKLLLNTIQRSQGYWLTSQYGRVIEPTIPSIASNIIAQGYDRETASRIFSEKLGSKFQDYRHWAPLASAVVHRTRNYGHLQTYAIAGITTYRIVAVMDARTTPFCRSADGMEFSVESAMGRMADQLQEKNPESFMRQAPFVDQNPKTEIMRYDYGGGSFSRPLPAGGKELRSAMLDRGSTFPPFHFLCRSLTDIVGGIAGSISDDYSFEKKGLLFLITKRIKEVLAA